MVKIIQSGLSKKTQEVILNWLKEDRENFEHDIEETIAWNALVMYLMELETLAEGSVRE